MSSPDQRIDGLAGDAGARAPEPQAVGPRELHMQRSLIALLLLLACGQPPANVAPELEPPTGARNIKHTKIEGFERIEYDIAAPFPPRTHIQHIAAVAENRGWDPLSESALNRGEKSAYVEGWRKRVVASSAEGPRRWAYLWWSQWTNDDGAIFDVGLTYTYPRDAPPDLSTLHVATSITSKERFKEIGMNAEGVSRAPSGRGPQTDAVTEEPDLESLMKQRGRE